MNTLQELIYEKLPKSNLSGLDSLDRPEFIDTELRGLNSGLKSHFGFCVFFSLVATANLFINLTHRNTENEWIYISSFIFIWFLCLFFFHTWFNKRKKVALLRLLKESEGSHEDLESWYKKEKDILQMKVLTKNTAKASYQKLGSALGQKRIFFLTQMIVFFLLLERATTEGLFFAVISLIMMLVVTLSLFDFKYTQYILTLKAMRDSPR